MIKIIPAFVRYLLYFIISGTITVLILGLEEFGLPFLSRIAVLVPVFTWYGYVFMSQFAPATEVASHASFLLWGTIFTWVPYMLAIIYLSPRIGVPKAVIIALLIFILTALFFVPVYKSLV